MKTRAITTLCITGAALLALSAWRGGCVPDVCPDLSIACPDLECENGFKVDANSCAICECVEELPPETCSQNADCPEGFFCAFDSVDPAMNCLGGDAEMNCGIPVEGECRPLPQDSCELLDEWACIESSDCDPVYEELACLMYCDVEDPECGCEEIVFIGCREAETEVCWGAWIDENGLCRAPNDGVYPAECCGLVECWSDLDCPGSMFCDFPYGTGAVDCEGGEGGEPVDCLVAEPGVCRAVEPECFSDVDCPEGFFCDFSTYGAADRPASGDDGAAAPDVMMGGFCAPLAESCAELDEFACLDNSACAPLYEEICLPCNCAEGENCESCLEDYCEPIFVGCEDAAPVGDCRDDSDCPNGYCEMVDTCGGLDCGSGAMCVFPSCDDGTEVLCDMTAPICPAGQTAAVREGCYECVDARSCGFGDCVGGDGCLPE